MAETSLNLTLHFHPQVEMKQHKNYCSLFLDQFVQRQRGELALNSIPGIHGLCSKVVHRRKKGKFGIASRTFDENEARNKNNEKITPYLRKVTQFTIWFSNNLLEKDRNLYILYRYEELQIVQSHPPLAII